MSYYRGDYYRGDSGNYYKGDPFLGAIAGAVARRVVAPLARKAGRWIGRQTVGGLIGRTAGAAATAATVVSVGREVMRPGPGRPIEIDVRNMLPGGEPMISRGDCPPGYHLNKADGPKGAKGTYCVKNRRMNPLNPRALKRGLRRAEDFEKFARRTVNALRSGPKKFKKMRATSAR